MAAPGRRMRFGRVVAVPPPTPLIINFGVNNPLGYGGYPIAGATASVGVTDRDTGLTSTDWGTNAASRLVPYASAGTAGTKGNTKTFAKGAGQTYHLSIPLAAGGSVDVDVLMVAATCYVTWESGDSGTTSQLRVLLAKAPGTTNPRAPVLGDSIISRDVFWSQGVSVRPPVAGYAGAGTRVGGTGYTGTGTYDNVPLTGGSGTGALAKITVASNAVATVHIQYPGTGYLPGDVLSASNTDLGGAGSGFTYTVINLNGRIRIESETHGPSTHSEGWFVGGGANMLQLSLDTAVSGNLNMPFDINYITFYLNVNVSHSLGITYNSSSGGGGYGAKSYRCLFENGPLVSTNNALTDCWQNFRSSTCTESVFRKCAYGVKGASNNKTFWFAEISWNDFDTVISDCINITGVGWNIHDNFGSNHTIDVVGQHADMIQHLGFDGGGVGLTTFGNIERNIWARNISQANVGDQQGNPLLADNFPPTSIPGAVVKNQLYLGCFQSVLWVQCFDAPDVRFNTHLSDFNAANFPPTGGTLRAGIVYADCTGGQCSNNVSILAPDFGGSSGYTAVNNKQLTKDFTSYNAALNNYFDTPITTRQQAKQALAPLLNGTLKLGDGTYSGALFPPNGDGSIDWNDGSVYVPH